MTSKENLNRILISNKAKKVRQLSEIAMLFEKEQQISERRNQIEQFKESLQDELELNGKFRDELPAKFLEREAKKRTTLVNAVTKCQIEFDQQVAEAQAEIAFRNIELAKFDCRIEKVEKTIQNQKRIMEEGRDILESEEIQQNV